MSETKRQRPAKAEDLNDGHYAVLASFRRSLRIFLAFSEDAARKAGLTPRQHQAILAICGAAPTDGMTINALAEQLLLKPQTTVELIDRLQAAKLVRRNRDDVDRRRVFLVLTDKAKRLLETLSIAHWAQIRRDAPQLTELLHQVADATRDIKSGPRSTSKDARARESSSRRARK
jgi:DNA-binding MarR family transcriptional regulator